MYDIVFFCIISYCIVFHFILLYYIIHYICIWIYQNGWICHSGTGPAACQKHIVHTTHILSYISVHLTYGGFPKMGVPPNRWFIRENHHKMDDLGVPTFVETPIFLDSHDTLTDQTFTLPMYFPRSKLGSAMIRRWRQHKNCSEPQELLRSCWGAQGSAVGSYTHVQMWSFGIIWCVFTS